MRVNLDTAVAEYMQHLDSMGYKESTKKASHIVLRRLVERHGGHRPLTSVNDRAIDRFMVAESKTRAGLGLRQSHSRLRAFFTWCEKTGRVKVTQNPMAIRRAPKFVEREQQRLHVSKFIKLLDIAGRHHPRDRALAAVGLYTMLRDSEMQTLRIRDLDLDAGELFAQIHKSNMTDRLAISAELDAELRVWLTYYQDAVGPLQPDWYLLPALDIERERDDQGRFVRIGGGVPIPTKMLRGAARILRPHLLEAGLKEVDEEGRRERLGAHTLRRSGARALYDALVARGRADALRVVQTQLHHKSAVQTAHYLGLSEDRATRDELIRGVSVFGLDQLTKIGGDDAASTGGLRQVRSA